MFIWRLALSLLAAAAFGFLTLARRWNVAAVFSVVFVVAMAGLAVIVTVTQVEHHRAEKAAGQETIRWPSLAPAQPAIWGPGYGSSSIGGQPRGAAAPSPVEGTR